MVVAAEVGGWPWGCCGGCGYGCGCACGCKRHQRPPGARLHHRAQHLLPEVPPRLVFILHACVRVCVRACACVRVCVASQHARRLGCRHSPAVCIIIAALVVRPRFYDGNDGNDGNHGNDGTDDYDDSRHRSTQTGASARSSCSSWRLSGWCVDIVVGGVVG
jgi:hypothetical protein